MLGFFFEWSSDIVNRLASRFISGFFSQSVHNAVEHGEEVISSTCCGPEVQAATFDVVDYSDAAFAEFLYYRSRKTVG